MLDILVQSRRNQKAAEKSPAAAHVHGTVPANECGHSTNAARNPTARNALLTRGAVHQGAQALPIGSAQGQARSQAVAHCQQAR